MIFNIITFISFIITSFIIMLCTSNSSSERRFRCEYSPSYFIYDNEDVVKMSEKKLANIRHNDFGFITKILGLLNGIG